MTPPSFKSRRNSANKTAGHPNSGQANTSGRDNLPPLAYAPDVRPLPETVPRLDDE